MVALFGLDKTKNMDHPVTKQIDQWIGDTDSVFFMAWTTTPWTLPSNLGLTVGGSIEYSLVSTFNPYTGDPLHVVLATALIGKYFKDEAKELHFDAYTPGDKLIPWQVLGTLTGVELEGVYYKQLMPAEANSMDKILELTPDADPFKVVLGDFVTTEY